MKHVARIAAAAALSLTASAATAQTVGLATDKPGTSFNAVGSGIASVASKNSDLNVVVRPYSGPAAWVPVLNEGEVDFGAMSASSAYSSFTGDNEAQTPYPNIRVVRAGEGSLMLGFAVRDDGPIKSFADLEGARIASDFGGHLSIGNSLDASLEIAGLTWDDVQAVPVVGANDGIEALVADRVDATWASLGQPAAREADTQIGVRYLPVPEGPEAERIYQEKIFPGARVSVAPAGAAPGADEPTRLLSYDAYLIAHKDVPDDTVRKMLEGLWEGTDELVGLHRGLSGFTHEAAVTSAPVAPYHPAAVEFYKEKGLWSDEAQARQDALMAEATGS